MSVSICLLFPDLLGTYGDSGNATILVQRLRWRGIAAELTVIHSGDVVPASCDLYVVGGGEDQPQALAADELGATSSSSPLARAVDSGAVVFAVCAGLQILGKEFAGPDGESRSGVGLLDCSTSPGRRRAVGELAVEPALGLGLSRTLSGYENHAGVTTVGPGAEPLGVVVAGVGNSSDSGVDGARAGRVLGTYMHGPALARNPDLADLLLGWVVGPLEPLDDTDAEELRRRRLSAAGGVPASGVAGILPRTWRRILQLR
ncbi:MAG: type 1 glutamine amidotransferase [Acidimicrobiales bacterium]